MSDLTISLIQTDIHWEEPDANLAMFEEKIWTINEATDVIVLPEMFTTGFSMNAENLAEPAGGKTFKWLRQMATQKNAAVTGSYMVKERDQYFNRLCFVYPNGFSEHYDKKHLFTLAGEGDTYTSGSERLIVEYKGWRICPMICYDLRFPVWARSRKSGDNVHEYDLLIYVANWPDARIDAWNALLKARAIENSAFCAGLNRTGTDAVSKGYPGHSAVYSFKGEEIMFSATDKLMTVKLSYATLMEFRERFPFQNDADEFTMSYN